MPHAARPVPLLQAARAYDAAVVAIRGHHSRTNFSYPGLSLESLVPQGSRGRVSQWVEWWFTAGRLVCCTWIAKGTGQPRQAPRPQARTHSALALLVSMQRGARSRAAAGAAAGQQPAGGAWEAAGAGAAGIPHITFRPFQPQAAALGAMPAVLPIPVALPSTASSLGAGGRLAGFGGGPTRSSAGSLFGGGGRGAAAELGLPSPFASAAPYDQPGGERARAGDEREVRRPAFLHVASTPTST